MDETNLSPLEENPSQVLPHSHKAETGHRSLVAIVFTDTVGFSKRMTVDEEGTLQLVQRDLYLMSVICQSYEGHILKLMGDGLLIVFNSAVQAVACSLEIQRSIHQQNLSLPPQDCLQHRIGIHLGDVLITETDVFGDGVNVASRLQLEAEPGGVCLSKTIYEVVQNRLPFYTNRIETRRLKNIGPMKAYQISPIEGGFTSPGRGSSWRRFQRKFKPYFWYASIVLICLFWVAVGASLGIWYFLPKPKPDVALSSAALHPSNSANPPKINPHSLSEQKPTPPLQTDPGSSPVKTDNFMVARDHYLKRYDFEGMRKWIENHPETHLRGEYLAKNCTEMEHLFNWWQNQLKNFSAKSPLTVQDEKGESYQFYPVDSQRVAITSQKGTSSYEITKLPYRSIEGIIIGLLKSRIDPNSSLAQQLQDELAKFNRIYTPKPPSMQFPLPQ